MEAMQIEAGTVTVIPLSPAERLIADIEAKPEVSYPGTVVASMLRLVLSVSSPPVITVHPTTDGRKGRKRTEEQRQRMADAARRRWAKRQDITKKAEGGDVSDVTTFQGKGDAGAADNGVAAVA